MGKPPTLGRVLILSTSAADATAYFMAGQKLGVPCVLALEQDASRRLKTAANPCGDSTPVPVSEAPDLSLDFGHREAALEIVQYARERPLAAIVAADARTAPACARAASMIGLKWHPPRAVDACIDESRLRQILASTGVQVCVGGRHAGELKVAALLDGSKMRVLGALAPVAGSGDQWREFPLAEVSKSALATVLRAARNLGLLHGPVSAMLSVEAETCCISRLDPIIPGSWGDYLRFRIPLVDEEVSLAEVIMRHALAVDVSRIYNR